MGQSKETMIRDVSVILSGMLANGYPKNDIKTNTKCAIDYYKEVCNQVNSFVRNDPNGFNELVSGVNQKPR